MSKFDDAYASVPGSSQFLCVVLLLLTSGALAAQNQELDSNQGVRNIVLVHGAWADGSGLGKALPTCWSRTGPPAA